MNRRDAGYTLLEMLVALVVFGLVMAGIAQTFRFGLAAWPAASRRAVPPQEMAALDAALTNMIVQALPGSMTGRRDGLAFTTSLPEGAGLNGGLADVSIATTRDGLLYLRFVPHPPGISLAPPAAARFEPLANGVSGLQLAYLAPVTAGAPAWSNSWSGDGLPMLIRIHLQLSSGKSWPDLVAAPAGSGG